MSQLAEVVPALELKCQKLLHFAVFSPVVHIGGGSGCGGGSGNAALKRGGPG